MTPTEPRTPRFNLDDYLGRFESAAALNTTSDPADFLPPRDHPHYLAVLRELLRVDLEFAWDRGDERRVENYRDRFPELFSDPDGLRAVAWEEFRLRQAAGEAPTPAEYRRRFGVEVFPSSGGLPHTERIDCRNDKFSVDAVPTAAVTEFPKAGDAVCGFEVESELGRGAFARVFLARERGLAGRQVVLKVSTKLAGESQTLARLQHSNIVPVYSVHRYGPYHVICMPFLGTTTVADLLSSFRGAGRLPGSGKGLLSTLAAHTSRTEADEPAHEKSEPAERSRVTAERIEHLSYPDAVLWLGVQLADGLAHAHERGVLHRDLKPANVLLADDGRPMLLDFNLAADAGGDPLEQAGVGGTLRYMPPETLAALAGRQPHADPTGDLYALGLILFELATGEFPFADPPRGGWAETLAKMEADRRSPPRDAALARPSLAPGIASILATCLQPDPARRYATAAELRDDLQRQLDSYPLAVAPNRSSRERLRKWARRHPRLSSAYTAGLVAAGVLAVVVAVFLSRQRELGRLDAADAWATVRTERDAIQGLLLGDDPPPAFRADALARSRRVLARYGAEHDPDWVNGKLIRLLPEGERDAARRGVSFVLSELSIALAATARHEPDAARRSALFDEALRANERAATDPSAVSRTRHERAALLRAAGRPQESTDPPDDESRVWEDIRAGRFRAAAAKLLPLTRGTEPSYTAWAALGYCRLRLGEPDEAVRCFDAAAALAPTSPAVFFHRGIALQETGRFAAARDDFDRVLTVHPDDSAALLNRALARIELKDFAGAIADLDRLEMVGSPYSRFLFVREHARRLKGDAAGAEADFRAGLAREPADGLGWVTRGRAKLRLAPPDAAGALADFEKAVALDPALVIGWENVAEVQSEYLRRPAESVAALGRVLELRPGHPPALAGRAVLHARAGRKDAALADVAACAGRKSDTLVLYQLGCACVLAGERDRGVGFLRSALRGDPTWAKMMAADADLKAVLGAADFQNILAAANLLAK